MGEACELIIDGVRLPAPRLEPALYVVSTPIGNLADVTIRALQTLAAADLVACEDTRVTARLLDRYGIRARLASYNDHNAPERRPHLLAALAEGRSVALASDAGTPLVSDPGYRLVTEAVAAGHRVVPVPGPSALLAALSVAGLPTDAFLFAGFLPPKRVGRRRRLAGLAAVPATLVFFEARQRLAESLNDMADVLGADRGASVSREITKLHEETVRGTLAGVAAAFDAREEIRGEIVVVVGPPGEPAAASRDELDRLLAAALAGHSPAAAAGLVAEATGIPRREVYARAIALKRDRCPE